MSNLNTGQRAALKPSQFGDPTNRLFPVLDQADLDAAAHLLGRAKDPAAVKKRLIAIARKLDLKLPDAWEADMGKGKAAAAAALKSAVHGSM